MDSCDRLLWHSLVLAGLERLINDVIGITMTLKHRIKSKYDQLYRQEKEVIGQALVKVNLGVAMPSEHRIVASFLKGTGIVAKVGALDELIEFFNEDEDKQSSSVANDGTQTLSEKTPLKEVSLSSLKEYQEDAEVTLREKVDSKHLKHE